MELPPQKRQRLIWRLAKYGVIAAAKDMFVTGNPGRPEMAGT